MSEEISNVRLQRALRNYIFRHPEHVHYMKSVVYCGSKIINPGMGQQPAVFVVANKEDAKFFGTTSCKNSWCCPVCSAKRMAEYASQIAAAIDALKELENQVAFMITLCVPHTSGMSCEEVTEILYNTWKDFTVHGNKTTNRGKRDSRWNLKDPFAMFCEAMNCRHRVRVGEYTHGKHGWHPHFHCLFWVDKDKLQKVAHFEDMLKERWTFLTKKNILKEWDKKFPEQKAENRVRLEIMYKKCNSVSQPLFISRTDDGKIRKQQSSQYICGWGADLELTGNYRKKATDPEHETPYQILERAAKDNDAEAYELFLEFARATRAKKHNRINFSVHSGIKKIIEEWKKTHAFISAYKKKATTLATKAGQWKVVGWFSSEEWRRICFLDTETPIKERILELSLSDDPRKRINEFLSQFSIKLREDEHGGESIIEDIMNRLIDDQATAAA